jgi:hypothetical protein
LRTHQCQQYQPCLDLQSPKEIEPNADVCEESQDARGKAKPGNDLNDRSEVCVGHSDLIERRGHALQQKLPE